MISALAAATRASDLKPGSESEMMNVSDSLQNLDAVFDISSVSDDLQD